MSYIRYLSHFSKKCGGGRTTLHGTINSKDNIQQINEGYISMDSITYLVLIGRIGIDWTRY